MAWRPHSSCRSSELLSLSEVIRGLIHYGSWSSHGFTYADILNLFFLVSRSKLQKLANETRRHQASGVTPALRPRSKFLERTLSYTINSSGGVSSQCVHGYWDEPYIGLHHAFCGPSRLLRSGLIELILKIFTLLAQGNMTRIRREITTATASSFPNMTKLLICLFSVLGKSPKFTALLPLTEIDILIKFPSLLLHHRRT